ncbi:hypothetical protein ACJIZ3_018959 [Penstemon smallii]|uniref:SHSP domain-containing protein n=1 Tax=Penstemon smallii TaxID=265156 RepID=A0ABD3SZW3_9LAMI
MERKINQLDEEFEPFCKWQRKEDRDILELHLQEFKKEHLKVQISNHGILKVSGERPLDSSRKSKFYKELQISSKYDASAIHAKFIHGWLYITMPKRKASIHDQIPKQESKAPIPNDNGIIPKEQIQKPSEINASTTTTSSEFPGRKFAASGLRLAKVAVTLAATAAVVAALAAYVVYMYKATMVEIDDYNS